VQTSNGKLYEYCKIKNEMKKISIFLSIAFCLSTVVGNLFAQITTDPRGEYGTWMYSVPNAKLEHFIPGSKFPPATIEGPKSIGVNDTKNVKLTPAMQYKMQSILQVYKGAYPKPYNETAIFSLRYIPAHINDMPFAYKMILGKNDFKYNPQGKIISGDVSKWTGYAAEGYGIVKVNSLSTGTESNFFIGELFKIVEPFSYNAKKTENGKFIERPKGIIYADAPQIISTVASKKSAPPTLFNNIVDNYYHKIKIEERENNGVLTYQISNYVLLTYNNKLPFIALTINDYLNALDEYYEDYFQDRLETERKYNSKNTSYAEDVKRINAGFLEYKAIAGELREINKNRLSNLAMVKEVNIFPTRKRDGKLENIFIDDSKNGIKFYRMDKNYYNGAKQDDIRTISVEWKEQIEVPLNENFPDENAKDKKGNLLTDVRFHSAMRYKFDWAKLVSLLSK
jgi:hypothetical protein